MKTRSAAAAALGLCAVSDLAAVPLLLGDTDHVPAAAGLVVAVIAFLTAIAAVGVARRSRRSRSVALGTRFADVAAAVPALAGGAGAGPAAAAVVTVVLSLAAVALVWRLDPAAALVPGAPTRS